MAGYLQLEAVERAEGHLRDLGIALRTLLAGVIECEGGEGARDRVRSARARQLATFGNIAEREIRLLLLVA